jgi:hypothetical protein
MKNLKTKILFLIIISIFFFGSSSMSCKRSMDGMIIITQASINPGKPNYLTGDFWRYIGQSQLAAINPENPEKSRQILTEEFFSACSPDISYDGRKMLFAARVRKDDPWQIWEMNLNNLKTKQITSSPENSIDPAYLPGERVVFSRSAINDSLKSGQILFTCNLDGTDQRRITFNPHTYFASSVLKDGRILTISRQVYPVQNESSMMVLRPDGTKSELFYKTSEGDELFSQGRETINGKIIFIEAGDSIKTGGSIVSISYNRPLHSRINLTTSIPGDFHSAFPLQSGMLMVSYRSSASEKYSLYEFDPVKMELGNQLHKGVEYDILEAVVIEEHNRPKKLPSEVDMGVKTGLLLCQNINVSEMRSPDSRFSFQDADRVEIVGIDSSLGVVEVEKDGSFYLKVTADTPFRIKTMDAGGRIINGPGSWLWLRPNERRGCVGCHEDNEIVPANKLALAVKYQPVAVPVHVSGVKEKTVELE